MKKIVFLLITSCNLLFLGSADAQVLNTESFDAVQFLPTGWATVGAAPNWARSTTMSAPITAGPHTGAGMARFRYPTAGGGVSNTETIATPVFDLTGRGNNIVPFSFWMYRDSLVPANNDSLTVYVNTSASLNGAVKIGQVARNRSINMPDTKAMNGWYNYTFNIPPQFAGSSNYVILKGTCYGPTATARRIYVDDVQWTAFPPACSGMPTGGSVNAAQATFCNGGGNTNLTLSGASTGSGLSYQWYTSSSMNGPYQAFGFNDTVALTGNLTSNQYYFVTVGCATSGLSMNSDTLTIHVTNSQGPNVSISYAPNDTICRFDTITLSASGAMTYVWSTGANPNLGNTATLQAAPLNTTTFSVVGTDSLGCPSSPVQKTIVVGARPNINNISNSNPVVCAGGSSTLGCFATSGAGGGGGGGITLSYAWAPNAGNTATTTVTPSVTTLYTVTVTGQFGCTRTDTTSVMVNPNLVSPSVVLTPDSLGYCQGMAPATVTLAASSNTPGVTYAWSATAGPPINSTNDSLTVNIGNNSITYLVSVTNPSNGCVNTASSSIYIFPTPNVNAVTSSATVCLNGSTVVNAQVFNTQGTPLSQYSFNWIPGNYTTQMATVTPVTTGNYFVTVTSPYGCSNMDSVMITINPNNVSPSLTVNPSTLVFCGTMGPVQLVATTNATSPTFQWTPGFISQNNDTITFTPNNTMNVSVSVTDANGCTTSAGATITLSPLPNAGFIAASGNNFVVDFTNTSTGANSYSWDFGDGTTSNQANPSHTYNNLGTWLVTLVVTNSDGCSDTITQNVNSQLAEVNELTWDVTVYPNPTEQLLHVSVSNMMETTRLSIFDATGKILHEVALNKPETTFNIDALFPGTYFLKIQGIHGSKTVRFIKA